MYKLTPPSIQFACALALVLYFAQTAHVQSYSDPSFCFNRDFAKTIPRPFAIRYNAYTQSVDIIDNSDGVERLVTDIKYNVDVLQDALEKIRWGNSICFCLSFLTLTFV